MSGDLVGRPAIRVSNLRHVYPGDIIALEDINLEIEQGSFIALIGQNGAGKTTLTKHLNGLLKPTAGEVWINGINTRETSTANLAHIVGYCFQNPDHQIFNDTVWDEVAYGPKKIGFEKEELEASVNWALKTFELTELMDDYPFVLSKGERQRVAVASVLAMRPSILVVDEPTTGQDYRESKRIMDQFKTLNDEGVTVIVVTHDMQLVAEYAERTVVMGKGQILIDEPTRSAFKKSDVLASTQLREPQITRLGFELGIPETVLTVSEMKHLLDQK